MKEYVWDHFQALSYMGTPFFEYWAKGHMIFVSALFLDVLEDLWTIFQSYVNCLLYVWKPFKETPPAVKRSKTCLWNSSSVVSRFYFGYATNRFTGLADVITLIVKHYSLSRWSKDVMQWSNTVYLCNSVLRRLTSVRKVSMCCTNSEYVLLGPV